MLLKAARPAVSKCRDKYFDTKSRFSCTFEDTKARMLNIVRVVIKLASVSITLPRFASMTAWRLGIVRYAISPNNESLNDCYYVEFCKKDPGPT